MDMDDYTRLKWPRTYHFKFSPGLVNDDRRLPDYAGFHDADGRPLRAIVTIKVDGEGATMNRNETFPRSPDGRYHASRDLMKAYHATKRDLIPDGWRVSGEYAYARHSIAYTVENGNALPDWFMGFGIWNERNVLLPWDETVEMFQLMDIEPVEVIHDGPFDEATIIRLAESLDTTRQEGLVVRIADAIPYPSGRGDRGRFFREVAKWVRKGHVAAGSDHWQTGPVIPNMLA